MKKSNAVKTAVKEWDESGTTGGRMEDDEQDSVQAKIKAELRLKLEDLERVDPALTHKGISRYFRKADNYISAKLSPTGIVTSKFKADFDQYYDNIMRTNQKAHSNNPDGGHVAPIPSPDLGLEGLRPLSTQQTALFGVANYRYNWTGDSMYPKIANGAELFVREVENKKIIVSGEIYLIYLDNGLHTVRYINLVPGEQEKLILAAYNDKAGSTTIFRKEIAHLFKILFIVYKV